MITYNMHGVNQGLLYLQSLCSLDTSVILLQETWLNLETSHNMFNQFADKYHVFCSSGMESKQSSEILKGRPFGGLCSLMHKSFYNCFRDVNCVAVDTNYIILKCDDLLIVNIYLPSSYSVSLLDSLEVILCSLTDHCLNESALHIIVGGDVNCNVLLKSNGANLILSAMENLNAYHSYRFLREKEK